MLSAKLGFPVLKALAHLFGQTNPQVHMLERMRDLDKYDKITERVDPMSMPRNEKSVNLEPEKPILDRQGKLLFVLMVFVGFIVTFAFAALQPHWRITNTDRYWGIALGVVYLLLGLNNQVIFDRLPAGWADLLFFSVQISLVFLHGQLLGVGGNGLMGVPLVWFGMVRLKFWSRLAVYAGLVAAVVSPLGLRYETWTTALINGLTISVIILFVAMFAHTRLKEQQARERAERLMVELERANTQLAAYATQAEELAVTQERNRLAREIHDNLGHTLTIVNVQIEAAKAVIESDPDRAMHAIDRAQELAKKGLADVRGSVAALRESPVSNRPLSAAIASLVEEAQSAGIVTEFQVTGEPHTLEHKIALALYRAAQEGLTNVRRHARASRVDVLLDFQPAEVRLQVADNGVGAAETAGGFGLLGIRERMHLLGGGLDIDTAVGKGFRLTASVPIVSTDGPDRPED
jgi:signal transduction histidine kinase